MTFEVPQVDITAYVEDGSATERALVARAVDEACRRSGSSRSSATASPTR